MNKKNKSHQFDILPENSSERKVIKRPTRDEILSWWKERFGLEPYVFNSYSFWEKGNGKIWIFKNTIESPVKRTESLGMLFLRTRKKYWKPTTEAAQKFGKKAKKNTIELRLNQASKFVSGKNQKYLDTEAEDGYVIVLHKPIKSKEILGIGLYIEGELRSQIPKGRRRKI